MARGSAVWITEIDDPKLLDNPKDSKSVLAKEIVTANILNEVVAILCSIKTQRLRDISMLALN